MESDVARSLIFVWLNTFDKQDIYFFCLFASVRFGTHEKVLGSAVVGFSRWHADLCLICWQKFVRECSGEFHEIF